MFDTRFGYILLFLLPLIQEGCLSVTGKKYVQEILVYHFGGLSLPRKSVLRLTDRSDMIMDVDRGSKTTNQQPIKWAYYVSLGKFLFECVANFTLPI